MMRFWPMNMPKMTFLVRCRLLNSTTRRHSRSGISRQPHRSLKTAKSRPFNRIGSTCPRSTSGEAVMLTLANVDAVYGGVIQVLRSANLEVRDGQMVALLGANGAGKTTTLKAISGLLHADHGSVTVGRIVFDGQDITHADPSEIVKAGVVQVLEGRKVLEHLTVHQNLMVGAHLRGDRAAVKSDLERVCDYFPALPELLDRTAGYLSGGEMQMVLIGRAIMARPRLLILDEPSMGLAPILTKQLFDTIARIKKEE